MATHLINIRHKGQITLPEDIQRDLGLEEGDPLVVERRGKEIVLIAPDDLVDRTAGAFAAYAQNGPVEWDCEEIWTEIAAERWDRLQQQQREADGEDDERR